MLCARAMILYNRAAPHIYPQHKGSTYYIPHQYHHIYLILYLKYTKHSPHLEFYFRNQACLRLCKLINVLLLLAHTFHLDSISKYPIEFLSTIVYFTRVEGHKSTSFVPVY